MASPAGLKLLVVSSNLMFMSTIKTLKSRFPQVKNLVPGKSLSGSPEIDNNFGLLIGRIRPHTKTKKTPLFREGGRVSKA